MPFGAPGGDSQVQSMLQVFLNIFHFGMDIQQAIDETSQADIVLVYENLMAGSFNHLRAFVGQMARPHERPPAEYPVEVGP